MLYSASFKSWHAVKFELFGDTLQNGAAPASNLRVPPAASEPLGFGQRHDPTVDIPLDNMNVMTLLIQLFSLHYKMLLVG